MNAPKKKTAEAKPSKPVEQLYRIQLEHGEDRELDVAAAHVRDAEQAYMLSQHEIARAGSGRGGNVELADRIARERLSTLLTVLADYHVQAERIRDARAKRRREANAERAMETP